MKSLFLDYSKLCGFVTDDEIKAMESAVSSAHKKLTDKTGEGNDFLGWLDLPVNYDKAEFAEIKKSAEEIKKNAHDILVDRGIIDDGNADDNYYLICYNDKYKKINHYRVDRMDNVKMLKSEARDMPWQVFLPFQNDSQEIHSKS